MKRSAAGPPCPQDAAPSGCGEMPARAGRRRSAWIFPAPHRGFPRPRGARRARTGGFEKRRRAKKVGNPNGLPTFFKSAERHDLPDVLAVGPEPTFLVSMRLRRLFCLGFFYCRPSLLTQARMACHSASSQSASTAVAAMPLTPRFRAR